MLRVYRQQLVGPVPQLPRAIEARIDQYLVVQAGLKAERDKQPFQALDDGLSPRHSSNRDGDAMPGRR
jgi:hypothetical protein